MFDYNFFQWLIFFYIYCFVGWCIESTIVSVEQKKFVNRGFLRSPMLPIYGFGALAILFSTLPVRHNPVLVYIFGMISTTALEYFTGWLMETTLKMKYWDYSNEKLNYKGRICVKSSLFWGFLSLFLMYALHDFIEKIVLSMSRLTMGTILIIVSFIFVSDLVYAIRTALDVNKILARMTEIKAELVKTKGEIATKIGDSDAVISAEERLRQLKMEMSKVTSKIDFIKKDFILAHPTARSPKFNEALSEVREKLNNRKDKSKNKNFED